MMGERYNDEYNKKGKDITCIINKNNTITNIENGNATDGNVTEPLTCEECFEKFLIDIQINDLAEDGFSIERLCDFLDAKAFSEEEVTDILQRSANAGDRIVNDIIECLLEAGVVFEPEPATQGLEEFNVPRGVSNIPGGIINIP